MRTASGILMGEALATPETAQPASIPRIPRSGKDRRVQDRRANDVQARTTKARRIRLTVLVLSGLSLVLFTHFCFILYRSAAEKSEPTGPRVVVEIQGVGTWIGEPKDLARSLATQDVITHSREIAPEVRLDMIAVKTQNLLDRKESLIRRIQEMPWREFERQAKFVASSPDSRPATQAEQEGALRVAVIRNDVTLQ